jgi:hypothetical protein
VANSGGSDRIPIFYLREDSSYCFTGEPTKDTLGDVEVVGGVADDFGRDEGVLVRNGDGDRGNDQRQTDFLLWTEVVSKSDREETLGRGRTALYLKEKPPIE